MSESTEKLSGIMDLRGKECVEIRLALRKKLTEIERGNIVKIITDSPNSTTTVPKWCDCNDQELFLSDEREGANIFFIKKIV